MSKIVVVCLRYFNSGFEFIDGINIGGHFYL